MHPIFMSHLYLRTRLDKKCKHRHSFKLWVAWYMGPGCTLQRSAWANDCATKMQPRVMPPEMSCEEGPVPRLQAETAGCCVPWDHTPSNCTQAAIPGSAKSSGLWAKKLGAMAHWLIVDACLWEGWELNGAEWSCHGVARTSTRLCPNMLHQKPPRSL